MKKIFLSLVGLFLAASIQAAEDAPEYSLYGENVVTTPNSEVKVIISMKNATEVTLAQADFYMPPSGFDVPKMINADGDEVLSLYASGTRMKSTHACMSNLFQPKLDDAEPHLRLRMLYASPVNATFRDNDGEIATLVLSVGDVEPGEYPVVIGDQLLVQPDETAFYPESTTFIVKVVEAVGIGMHRADAEGRVNDCDLEGRPLKAESKGVRVSKGKVSFVK